MFRYGNGRGDPSGTGRAPLRKNDRPCNKTTGRCICILQTQNANAYEPNTPPAALRMSSIRLLRDDLQHLPEIRRRGYPRRGDGGHERRHAPLRPHAPRHGPGTRSGTVGKEPRPNVPDCLCSQLAADGLRLLRRHPGTAVGGDTRRRHHLLLPSGSLQQRPLLAQFPRWG